MAERNLLNGFTGFGKQDPGFVSASEAIRRQEMEVSSYQREAARRVNAWGRQPESNILQFAREKSFDAQDLTLQFDPEKLAQIPDQDRRWAWIEVDLNAIRHNVIALRHRMARGTRLMAVVKANGYGHGAVQSAKTALNTGADYLGVSSIDEAIELREGMVNAPILILSEPPKTAIPLLLGYKVMPSIYTPEFAIMYAEAANSFGLRAPYHLKINTGMNRIGVRYDEALSFLGQIGFHQSLDLVGTYTHFATAEGADKFDFNTQARRFYDVVEAMRCSGYDPGIVHAANSAAAIRYPEVHFDMVRSGLALYGYHPCPETRSLIGLEPAMSVHARITDTRYAPVGEGVSYGLNYRSSGSVKICTIPVGYADGLRRSLSGRIDFLFDGERCRQVGDICMDQCMFEVDLRTYANKRRMDPQIGDEVIIVGKQGRSLITIDELCDAIGTIPYEMTVGFSHRMPCVVK